MLSYSTFNPDDFFTLAASIVRDRNANEAALRTAISRAYYAVFLTARDSLFGVDEALLTKGMRNRLKKKFRQKKKRELGSHEIIIFAIEDKTNRITLCQQIDQLREARTIADYRLEFQHLLDVGKQSWREYAEETVSLASQVLPAVKRLPSY